MKYLHQCYVFTLIADTIGIGEVLYTLHAELGGETPSTVFRDNKGAIWTGWIKLAYLIELSKDYQGPKPPKLLADKYAWIRPNMVYVKEDWRGKIGRPSSPSILVECKHEEFNWWWEKGKVVDKQLRLYKELINPKNRC